MRVTVNRERLAGALSALERVAAMGRGAPVLSGVLLEASDALRLRSTDLTIAMAAALEPIDEMEAGATVLDAKLLSGIVRKLSCESVTLMSVDDGVAVQGGGARFTLRAMAADEFPGLMVIEDAQALTVPARELARVLGRVAVAAAVSDQRPVLSSVLVEWVGDRLELAATDSSRLAYEALALPSEHGNEGEPIKALIPVRSAQEIVRICERVPASETAMLEIGSRLAAVEVAGFRLVTRLMEGSFPPYKQVLLQDPPTRLVFNREPLLQAIERLSILTRKGPAVVQFAAHDGLLNGVRLRSTEADVGEGEEVIELAEGEWPQGVTVAYQARFLTDALKAMDTETVVYELADPQRQGQFRAGGYSYIVMPVRLG